MTPLLEAGLSGPVVAENVLPFLDHRSLMQLLWVDAIWEHFSLKNHYCRWHGTPLEYWECYPLRHCHHHHHPQEQDGGSREETNRAQDGHRIGGAAATAATTAAAAAAGDKNENNGKNGGEEESSCITVLVCQDCEQKKRGYMKCFKCDKFAPQVWFFRCASCRREGDCLDCDYEDWNLCSDCGTLYCGREECASRIHLCKSQVCRGAYCENCRDPVCCFACQKKQANCGCFANTRNSFTCNICDKTYCWDCKKSPSDCIVCMGRFCRDCKQLSECTECHGDVCPECATACPNCQRTFCPRCLVDDSCTLPCSVCNIDQPCLSCSDEIPPATFRLNGTTLVTCLREGPSSQFINIGKNVWTDTAVFAPKKTFHCRACGKYICGECSLAHGVSCNHCHTKAFVCPCNYKSCETCQGKVCGYCYHRCPNN